MKKLLIATDFSADAEHAAEYGYLLAKQMKAGIFLCNVVTVPAEAPMAGMVAWPMEESETLLEESKTELQRLKAHLERIDQTETFKPPVNYLNEPGTVVEIINNNTSKQNIDFVIAGTHQHNGFSTFLLGNHTHDLLEYSVKPLLVIPRNAVFKPVGKIAFATDFEHPENDLEQIYQLTELARTLNAEILLTHILNETDHSQKFEKHIVRFLVEISNKANYPKIYYRIVKQSKTEAGLNWLCEHEQIDMLAMVHRKHGFFDTLLNGSHTQRMAAHISVPLLVYPA